MKNVMRNFFFEEFC